MCSLFHTDTMCTTVLRQEAQLTGLQCLLSTTSSSLPTCIPDLFESLLSIAHMEEYSSLSSSPNSKVSLKATKLPNLTYQILHSLVILIDQCQW